MLCKAQKTVAREQCTKDPSDVSPSIRVKIRRSTQNQEICSAGSATFKVNVNLVPFPGMLSTSIRPP
jgi:hypothetical protein